MGGGECTIIKRFSFAYMFIARNPTAHIVFFNKLYTGNKR